MDENEIELSDEVIKGLKLIRNIALESDYIAWLKDRDKESDKELEEFDEALEWLEQFNDIE